MGVWSVVLLAGCVHAPPKPAPPSAPPQLAAPVEPEPVPVPIVPEPSRDLIAWWGRPGALWTAWVRDGQVVARRPELVVFDEELLVWLGREVEIEVWSCGCSAAPSCCEVNEAYEPEAPQWCRRQTTVDEAALVSLETGEVVHEWADEHPSGWVEISQHQSLVGGVGSAVLLEQSTTVRGCDEEHELGGPFPEVEFYGTGDEVMPLDVDAAARQRAYGPEILEVELLSVAPVRRDGRIVAALWRVAVTSVVEDDIAHHWNEIEVEGPVPEAWAPWVEPPPSLAILAIEGGEEIEGWSEIPADRAGELLAVFQSAAGAVWPPEP